jgi:hypothetical protein
MIFWSLLGRLTAVVGLQAPATAPTLAFGVVAIVCVVAVVQLSSHGASKRSPETASHPKSIIPTHTTPPPPPPALTYGRSRGLPPWCRKHGALVSRAAKPCSNSCFQAAASRSTNRCTKALSQLAVMNSCSVARVIPTYSNRASSSDLSILVGINQMPAIATMGNSSPLLL